MGSKNLHASLLHRQLGRLDEAVEAYNASLALAPSDARALSGLGTTHALASRLEAAEACFVAAIRLAPGGVGASSAYNSLGVVLEGQARLSEAVEAFEAALSLRPNWSKAESNLAEAKLKIKRAGAVHDGRDDLERVVITST